MRIRYTLAVGFGITVLLVAAVGIVSSHQLCQVARPLSTDIPEAVAVATRLKREDSRSQLIRYYDEVLTQSARNFAFTQDPKWEQRYEDVEPKLEAAIREALRDADEKDRELFVSIDQANLDLVEMEHQSLQLVQAGRAQEAVAILDSREYWGQKTIYEKGLMDYAQRSSYESGDALDVSTGRIRAANRMAEEVLRASILWVLGVVIVGVLLSTVIGAIILRSISRLLEQLRTAATALERGDLQMGIDINPHDEMGQLAASFVEMAANLRHMTASMGSLHREIAARTRMENELRLSEERFRMLFECAPDAYFLHDLQGRILDVNRRAEQLIGYTREEQIGHTVIDLGAVPPSEVDRVLSAAAESAAGRSNGPKEITLQHKGGSAITVEITTLPVRIGGEPIVLGIAHDITGRKAAEEKLREQKDLLKNIISHIPHFVFWKDGDSVYLGCNEVFARSAGLENPNDIIGKTDYDLVWEKNADFYRHCDRQVMESGEPLLSFEEPQTREDGSQITLLTSKVPLRDASGRVIGILGIYADITDRKRAERRQTETLDQLGQANQDLKDFAYVVSHDLKAPLRAIRMLADWLCADYYDKLDEQGRENLQLLGNRVDRMQSLIDGILQYSRVGRTEQSVACVSLGQIVPEIVATLGAPENISIRIENDLPTVEADPTRITQIFQNLLSNAIKCMDKPQGEIRVGCVEEDGFWKFSVCDNGPGIEQQHFERIFKLFQTLTPRDTSESTGVGLTITKKIVEMYGGKIWVESEVGHGSTFFFTLPKLKMEVRDAQIETDVACAP